MIWDASLAREFGVGGAGGQSGLIRMTQADLGSPLTKGRRDVGTASLPKAEPRVIYVRFEKRPVKTAPSTLPTTSIALAPREESLGGLIERCRARGWAKAAGRTEWLVAETATFDWDTDRGKPIPADAWCHALGVLFEFAADWRGQPFAWGEPFVAACGDGSVHFYWYPGGKEVRLEVFDDQIDWTDTRTGSRDGTTATVEGLRAALLGGAG